MSKLLRMLLVLGALALAFQFEPLRSMGRNGLEMLRGGVDDVTGRTALDIGQEMKRDMLRSRLRQAVVQYRAVTGEEPRQLEDLVAQDLLQRADLEDEWGRPLRFEMRAAHLVVRGLGADASANTDDDWILQP